MYKPKHFWSHVVRAVRYDYIYGLTIPFLFWYLKEKQIFTLPLNLCYYKVWPIKPWSLWSKFFNINWRNTLNPNSGKHEKSARSASAVAPQQTEGAQGGNRTMVQLHFWARQFLARQKHLGKNHSSKKYRFGAKLRCIQWFEICGLSQRWYVFVQKEYLKH